MAKVTEVVYFAHPLGGDIDANMQRALRWLSWLYDEEPDTTFVAPWLVGVSLFRLKFPPGIDDKGHPFRERCMRDNLEAVGRCDGIIGCGGMWSPGMVRERDSLGQTLIRFGVGTEGRFLDEIKPWISDLTELGPEPPAQWSRMLGRPSAYGRVVWSTRHNR